MDTVTACRLLERRYYSIDIAKMREIACVRGRSGFPCHGSSHFMLLDWLKVRLCKSSMIKCSNEAMGSFLECDNFHIRASDLGNATASAWEPRSVGSLGHM